MAEEREAEPEPEPGAEARAEREPEPEPKSEAEREPESESESEPKRPPYVAIFTFVACCVGIVQWLHEFVETYNTAIVAVEETLRRVDFVALAGGYVDGLRRYPVSESAGALYPYIAVLTGLRGMFEAMLTGGWISIVAGLVVVAAGIAINFYALSWLDRKDGGVWRRLAFGVVGCTSILVAAAIGVAVNSVVARLSVHSLLTYVPYALPVGAWLGDNLATLAASFFPVALGAGHYGDVGPFLAEFARAHPWFVFETMVVGLLPFLAFRVFGEAAAVFGFVLFPFVVLGIVLSGAIAATIVDHLLVIPAIDQLLRIATISALPLGLGAVAFWLEKGHLSLSFVEATRKLFGRE